MLMSSQLISALEARGGINADDRYDQRMHEPARKLSEVIGANARSIREAAGATLDDVAVAGRALGLKWVSSRVSNLEHGRSAMTIETLIGLAEALGRVAGNPIYLSDLVRGDAPIVIGSIEVPGADVGEWFGHKRVDIESRVALPTPSESWIFPLWDLVDEGPAGRALNEREPGSAVIRFRDVSLEAGQAEARAADALGISGMELAAHSVAIWGHSLSSERDLRSVPGDSAQRKGRITRELLDELRASIAAAAARGALREKIAAAAARLDAEKDDESSAGG